MKRLSFYLILFFTFSSTFVLSSDGRRKDDPWVPMEERVKIWDEVVAKELSLPLPLRKPKPYKVSENGLEATFEKHGVKWTIIGANAPIVNQTVYPKDWPVKGNDFKVLVIPEPITNYKILPFTEKIENAVKSDMISITAAKDSYEPASFVIRSADVDMKNVMVEVTDLRAEVKDKNGKINTVIIPKQNIDIRTVKCWYQAGKEIYDVKHKLLTPELLLHDDELVRVDYDRQVNILKDMDKIQDARSLKLFELPKHQNKQIWLTIKIPEKAVEGNYLSVIQIKEKGVNKSLKLALRVLPFKLAQPNITSSIYYRGTLDPKGKGPISSELKSETQLRNELKDMWEHGVTNPTVYQSFDKGLLGTYLRIRNEVGMGKRPLYYLGVGTGNPTSREELSKLGNTIRDVVAFCRAYGIPEVYFYGLDEAEGSRLKSQRDAWTAVHEAGGRVFVAGYRGSNFGDMGDIQDVQVNAGGLSKEEADKWHSKGHKIWTYSNPQGGVEEPETYRRNYGIALWSNNYDGACNYAYQHSFGSGWNDFDDIDYRDHNFTYPTVDGAIDTIEWEGYREGVNDLKYFGTLIAEMKQVKGNRHNKSDETVNDMWPYLHGSSKGNLTHLRGLMIESLQNANADH